MIIKCLLAKRTPIIFKKFFKVIPPNWKLALIKELNTYSRKVMVRNENKIFLPVYNSDIIHIIIRK